MSDLTLYTYSAKSLQSYVLGGDQLKEIVGATSLIDTLCQSSFIESLLQKLGISDTDYQIEMGAAGAARVLFQNKEDCVLLSSILPFVFDSIAPGLEVVQSIETVCAGGYLPAVEKSEVSMAASRNAVPTSLPQITPLVQRSARSGLAATWIDNHGPVDDQPAVDRIAKAKRERRHYLRGRSEPGGIFEYFRIKSEEQIPQSFESISGSEREYLAVLHADGNRLGQQFIKLSHALVESSPPPTDEIARKIFAEFSETISLVARKAAGHATDVVLGKVGLSTSKEGEYEEIEFPFLPIVLAGDDLTLVIRADLAISFAEEFLNHFTSESIAELKNLKTRLGEFDIDDSILQHLPGSLSAGAGIAFVKTKYPFSEAYALCESLAHHAKSLAKKSNDEVPPNTLAFYRVTGSSSSTDFKDLITRDLLGKGNTLLTKMPYRVGGGKGESSSCFPLLSDLRQLVTTLAPLSKSQPRELVTLMAIGSPVVTKRMERFLKLIEEDHGKKTRDDLVACLKRLGGTEESQWLLDSKDRSPLRDAILLSSLETARSEDFDQSI